MELKSLKVLIVEVSLKLCTPQTVVHQTQMELWSLMGCSVIKVQCETIMKIESLRIKRKSQQIIMAQNQLLISLPFTMDTEEVTVLNI